MWQQGLSAFSKALEDRDFDSAERAIRAMLKHSKETGDVPPDDVARKVLARLRKHAWFDLLYEVGGAFQKAGNDGPVVRLQLAQARIEQGETTRAIAELCSLRRELEAVASKATGIERGEVEFHLSETLGLLGRAYKQMYIDAHPIPKNRGSTTWSAPSSCIGWPTTRRSATTCGTA